MAACLFPLSRALGAGHDHTKFVDYAQVDAFTAEPFKGNPAVVCLLPTARTAKWMQDVAAEFNAPMAAFLTHRQTSAQTSQHAGQTAPREYDVRFFTPTTEVPLCGHASLASAHLLFESDPRISQVVFHAGEGIILNVRKVEDQVELALPFLPTSPLTPAEAQQALPRTLQGCEVVSAHTTDDHRLVVEVRDAREVEALRPCFEEIVAGPGAVVVTGKGQEGSGFDFVSRFFAPGYGVPEDPVCGTAHSALAPLWARKLKKQRLMAFQASQRGGVLDLSVDDEAQRVVLRATGVLVAAGVLLC